MSEPTAEGAPVPTKFSEPERLIITMLDRLFWLMTQAPNVARYGSDVTLFTEAAMAVGAVSPEDGARRIEDYNRERS